MDNRDFRIRIDLTFAPKDEKIARTLYDYIISHSDKAIIINKGLANEEKGLVEIERCGHRLKLPCEVIARREVL